MVVMGDQDLFSLALFKIKVCNVVINLRAVWFGS